MISFPVYKATTSLSACLFDTNQTIDWLLTVFLSSYSITNSSYWWKKAVIKVFRILYDFFLVIYTVEFISFLDPTITAILLSKRLRSWLNTFLKLFYQNKAIKELCYNSLLSIVKAIITIIRQRLFLYTLRWKEDWLFSVLFSLNISIVTKKLNY